MRTVAVIGGGVSGLISTKCCLDGDLLPTCYEMTKDIGGLWNYDENAVDGKASVMKSTEVNTSKEFMAFSDFPPPADYPNYMHNSKLLSYFRMYASKFDLLKYFRFRRRVTRIEPTDDYEQTGCWLIYSVDVNETDEEKIRNNELCERFDAVMLATGHHAFPRWATFPGFDKFQGGKLHSWQYKTPHGFEDKTVLIVGIGSSAGDMAVELGRAAKQVYLSTRRGTWVYNRVGPNGWPTDMYRTNLMLATIQKYFPWLMNRLIERELSKKFNHELYSLKPDHLPLQQHPFINDDLPNRILCGSVIIKPNIKEFSSDGHSVLFEDSTKVDHVDCVLMATGFNIAFPYLNESILSVKDNKIQLYKFVWPSHLAHPTLAVMGLIQPWGAINPMTELQARWAVRAFKRELKLPSRLKMDEDIHQRFEKMSKRYVSSPRHTIQVDYIEYCNELANEVGCLPNILSYLLNDFSLGWLLLCGPCTPYRYRLEGPNKWKDARHAILTQDKRVECPLRDGKRQNQSMKYPINPTFVLSFIFLVVVSLSIFIFFWK
ncbi:unnamed protein product [Rotaria socialis]|uniref:Flavin-containing monooxygenase n=1 Tax=Rotaria socialis TaxID=392032 RepID=A0A817LDC7_9BILA|nr:unnamed protein product [Rotaria socialis]